MSQLAVMLGSLKCAVLLMAAQKLWRLALKCWIFNAIHVLSQ